MARERRKRNQNKVENRNNVNNNRHNRRRNRRKKSKLLSIFIVIALSVFVFLYVQRFRASSDYASSRDYYDSNFDDAYNSYSKNLYFKKYNKNEEGLYVAAEETEILNKADENYDQFLVNELMLLFEENNINQADLYLEVSTETNSLLSIQNNNVLEGINLDRIILLLMVRDKIDQQQVTLQDSVSLIESDLVSESNIFSTSNLGTNYQLDELINQVVNNNDYVAFNMIARYLSTHGITLDSFKRSILSKDDVSSYTIEDTIKIIKYYNSNKNSLNNYFAEIFRENDSLFLNAIYTNENNINYIYSQDNVKFDMGYVNNDIPYYYSIYSNNLSEENIHYIGDIINRTLSDINIDKNIDN